MKAALWDIMTLFAANAIVYYALCFELRYKGERFGKDEMDEGIF